MFLDPFSKKVEEKDYFNRFWNDTNRKNFLYHIIIIKLSTSTQNFFLKAHFSLFLKFR